ncbi:hypothetical protein [Streptomyces sp. NPDC056949]
MASSGGTVTCVARKLSISSESVRG